MNTNTTELAQRMKAAAVRAKAATEDYVAHRMSITVYLEECKEFNDLSDGPDNIIALVETLEKVQGMEAYWKTQCRGITDHCVELQARNAELECRTVTVKLPKFKMLEDYLAGVAVEEREAILLGVRMEFHRALNAEGIKWEVE